VYSKYHGGILILLSILLNLKLLKNKKLYASGLLSLLIISPHIYWQYQHDFVTFKYHLFDRADIRFKLKNIVGYIFGSTLVLNPALLLLLLWFIKVKKFKIDKEIKFYANIIAGFLLFFFIYAFRSKIEPHWVAFAMIPLVIVLHSIIITFHQFIKIVKNIIYVSITAMVIMRILVILDLPIQSEFHKEGREFFNNISEVAGNQNIAFMNSYQKAAKYSYYTGKDAYSLNNTYYRKNPYDFWDYGSKFHNKDVFVISNWPSNHYDSIKFNNGEAILGKNVSNFQMFSNINISLNRPITEMKTTKSYDLYLNISNPYPYVINLEGHNLDYKIALQIKDGNSRRFIPVLLNINTLGANSSRETIAKIALNKNIPPGSYKCTFVMKSGFLPYQVVSNKKFELSILNTKKP